MSLKALALNTTCKSGVQTASVVAICFGKHMQTLKAVAEKALDKNALLVDKIRALERQF